MQLKKNKKGMTLIEIVVVLLISTIIMSIVGSMILSSMGYFSEEVVSQQDKEGLIDISSYIRKELSYATDVRVAAKIPTEDAWHWLSIENGKLYKDDKQLLSDSYYQNRKITVKVYGFDNYRLDINLKYLDNANKAVASNKTSLELMNLKADKDVVREYAPFSTAMDIDETQKIYYIIKEKVVEPGEPEKPDSGKTETVEDQLACINNYNNRETYTPGGKYNVGDYVQTADGIWWLFMHRSEAYPSGPGSKGDSGWKKLTSEFANNSSYEKNDVVIYKSVYYRARKEMLQIPTPTPDTSTDAWQSFGTEKPDVRTICKPLINEQKIKTVRNELDSKDEEKFPEYNGGEYNTGSYVKITDNKGIVKYYIKIKKNGSAPGDGTGSGWKRLARDLDVNSSYLEGDIVLYHKDDIVAVRFIKDIDHPNIDIVGDITSTQGHKYVELIKKGDES